MAGKWLANSRLTIHEMVKVLFLDNLNFDNLSLPTSRPDARISCQNSSCQEREPSSFHGNWNVCTCIHEFKGESSSQSSVPVHTPLKHCLHKYFVPMGIPYSLMWAYQTKPVGIPKCNGVAGTCTCI